MRLKECKDCGTKYEFDLDSCPSCNSTNHIKKIIVGDKFEVHDQVKGKSKIKIGKKKKPKIEFIAGEELQVSTGSFVEKTRIINRETDSYREKVIVIETGEVIHETDEKLSDHFGHGSDKNTPPGSSNT